MLMPWTLAPADVNVDDNSPAVCASSPSAGRDTACFYGHLGSFPTEGALRLFRVGYQPKATN